MTQEQKQLLIKDLYARVPYGVIVDYKENEFEAPHWKITAIYPDTFDGRIGYDKRVGAGYESGSRPFKIGEVKPYLRHMSSMTEEEKMEVTKLGVCYDGAFHNDIYDIGIGMDEAFTAISWFLERHFDINYLIEKGLALEAPEGMYETV